MRLITIYDISGDPLRNKVANRLKDYGMKRIQYSAFYGNLSVEQREELQEYLENLLEQGEETDSVLFFPICSDCFQKSSSIGQVDLVTLEELKLIFV